MWAAATVVRWNMTLRNFGFDALSVAAGVAEAAGVSAEDGGVGSSGGRGAVFLLGCLFVGRSGSFGAGCESEGRAVGLGRLCEFFHGASSQWA